MSKRLLQRVTCNFSVFATDPMALGGIGVLALSLGFAAPALAEVTSLPNGVMCARPAMGSGTWTCKVPTANGAFATVSGVPTGVNPMDVDIPILNAWIASSLGPGAIVLGNLTSSATGPNSIAVGSGANAFGAGSVAIGENAGTGGQSTNVANLAVGTGAGTGVSGGTNVAIGVFSGTNVTGNANTAFGTSVGQNVQGNQNVGSGSFAGNTVIGNFNVASGISAGNNVTGNSNSAFGDNSGSGVSGASNVGIGVASGINVSGNNNIATGFNAGQNVTGSNNIAFGRRSGSNISASNTISIGNGATASAVSSVAVGQGATAATANSVALGNGAATTAAVGTSGTTIRGQTYSFAGTAPVGTVSVGTVGQERTVTNVAAGQLSASSTDAVNGSQLYATNQAIETIQGGVGTLDKFAVKYDNDGTNKFNSITLVGGDPSAPVIVSNVAAGVKTTDAVNVGQLKDGMSTTLNQANNYTDLQVAWGVQESKNYTNQVAGQTLSQANAYTDQKFARLNGEIGNIRKEARQAAAVGLAAASLRYDDRPGKLSTAVGGGAWRGEGAFAFGLGYTSENGLVRTNLSGTSSGGHWGIGAGLSLTLN